MNAFADIQKEYGEASAILYLWALEDKSCIEDYSCIVHILKAMAETGLQPERLLLAGNMHPVWKGATWNHGSALSVRSALFSENKCYRPLQKSRCGHNGLGENHLGRAES